MITIEEVQSIKSQIETDGIVPSSGLTISAVCDLAISQHEEIERLRADSIRISLCYQAEIERLRTQLDKYTRRSESGESLGDAIDMAEEIESLRAANKDLQEKYLGTREGRLNALRGEPK